MHRMAACGRATAAVAARTMTSGTGMASSMAQMRALGHTARLVQRPSALTHALCGRPVQRMAMSANAAALRASDIAPKSVAYWLFASAGMVSGMVVVGGYTRLSRAGLSMTSWKLGGSKPPSTQEQWEEEFERYKRFPEFKANPSMTLDEFRHIFHIEYGHRMLGRLTGAVFLVPLAVFAARRAIPAWLWPRLGLMGAMGAFQGLVGWWMVKSGLSRDTIVTDDPRVSPYRLAAHLTMAFATYSLLVWNGMHVLRQHAVEAAVSPAGQAVLQRVKPLALAATVAAGVTAFSGAFVAGLDAGHAYNDWPFMAERIIPEQIWEADLGVRNFFENTATVQFDHRLLAYTTLGTVGAMYAVARRGGGLTQVPKRVKAAVTATTHMAGVQVLLGISTLMMYVPLHLGVTHQAGALALWTCGLWANHALRVAAPIRNAARRVLIPM